MNEQAIRDFKKIFSDRFSTNSTHLESVSMDESSLEPVMPDAVAWCNSEDEIVAAVNVAYEHGIPITARGAGTSLEGNSIPVKGSIVLDFSQMNEIIAVYPEDLQVTVQPGIIYDQLNDKLSQYGLFFPPSPGGSSDTATIGGMVSTNASGIYSVKYGGTRNYVLQLNVVTGTGELITVGSGCKKTTSGYALKELIVGSEGTLGIVTEITLRLDGIPESRKRDAFLFPAEKNCTEAVATMMSYGLDLGAVEYIDKHSVEALNMLHDYGLPEKPALFLETMGSEANATEMMTYASQVCGEFGGEAINVEDPWEIRHEVTTAIKLRKQGFKIIRNDVAFPISRLPEIAEKCYEMADDVGLLIHLFGHVGIGILHALILANSTQPDELRKADELNQKIIETVVEMGGSISGEHGIGIAHKNRMTLEHSRDLHLMKGIKKLFDPQNILNPGKIFDVD